MEDVREERREAERKSRDKEMSISGLDTHCFTGLTNPVPAVLGKIMVDKTVMAKHGNRVDYWIEPD